MKVVSLALCWLLTSASLSAYAADSHCDNLIAVVRAQSGDADAVFIHSFAPGDFEAQLPPLDCRRSQWGGSALMVVVDQTSDIQPRSQLR